MVYPFYEALCNYRTKICIVIELWLKREIHVLLNIREVATRTKVGRLGFNALWVRATQSNILGITRVRIGTSPSERVISTCN